MIAALLAWLGLSFLFPETVLPGPWRTIQVLAENFANGDILSHLTATLGRVLGGLVLAMAIGIPVGVLMGVNRLAEKTLDVWVMVALTVPSLCYAIFAFIWIGLNETAAIVAIGLTSAPSIAINLWEGVKNIDTRLFQMARVFNASRWVIIRRVLFPQVLPYIMASLRFGLGIVWKITVLVELLGRPDGVGFELFYWYQLGNMQQVLAWTLLFTLVMLFIELVILQNLERRMFSWRPEVRI
ncbi:binding-protein-dependent transport system inner membrane protein [Alcanivorax sp. 521-1]|uniref:Binding-protein-dependent transport system inner membrane protein n=1 Tax=Alloalcanivorax profundimaris TaxID=2735259 RepID=A0ABS0AT35_9GAMM|nr:ABC transporter permease [Alloalcanivorax profundimaris]MBF5057301.1 binding-protein-dependent transport system inner membrane protein [Alloalcanivorax profundimaris]